MVPHHTTLPPLSRLKSSDNEPTFTTVISYILHRKPPKVKPSTVHCSFKGHSFISTYYTPSTSSPPAHFSGQSHVSFRKVNQVTCFILKRLLDNTPHVMLSPDSPLSSEIFSIKDPRPLTAHLTNHGPNAKLRVFFNESDSNSSNTRGRDIADTNSDQDMIDKIHKADLLAGSQQGKPHQSETPTKTKTRTKKKKKKYFKRGLPSNTTHVKSDVPFDKNTSSSTQERMTGSDFTNQTRKTKRKKNTGANQENNSSTTPASTPTVTKDDSYTSKNKINPEEELQDEFKDEFKEDFKEDKLSIKIYKPGQSCSRPGHHHEHVHDAVLESMYKSDISNTIPSWYPTDSANDGVNKQWTSDEEKMDNIRQTVSQDRIIEREPQVRYTNLSLSMPNTREGRRINNAEIDFVPGCGADGDDRTNSNSWLFECRNIWNTAHAHHNPSNTDKTRPPHFFDANPRHNVGNSKINNRFMHSMKYNTKKTSMRTVKKGSFVLLGTVKNVL